MKTNKLLMLVAIAGMASLLPSPVSAAKDKEDDKPKDKQERGKSESHRQDNKSPQGNSAEHRQDNRSAQGNSGTHRQNPTQATQERTRVTPQSTSTVQNSQSPPWKSQSTRTENRDVRTQQRQSPTTSSTSNTDRMQRSDRTTDSRRSDSNRYTRSSTRSSSHNHSNYNRDNRYGGLWFSAGTHSSWDRNRRYTYNNHQYRWYDGGWLIIDAGYTPDFTYSNHSIEMRVQIELRDRGYYRGPIDGDVGYGTRRAIVQYQGEHHLRVTGQINDALLSSLRL